MSYERWHDSFTVYSEGIGKSDASLNHLKGVTMTKNEAINRAAAARYAAKLALTRHALYATTFGGNDKLTQAAMLEHDVALEAHNKWMDVAAMHPKTRASLIRKQALPSFMFGYKLEA